MLSMQATAVDDYEDKDAYRQPLPPADRAKEQDKARPDRPFGQGDGEETDEDLSKIPRGDAGPQTGKEEKDELMKKSAEAGKRTNKVEYKGYVSSPFASRASPDREILRERIVTDPVTGQDVIVKVITRSCVCVEFH